MGNTAINIDGVPLLYDVAYAAAKQASGMNLL
jgi:hypothetical protein